MELENLQRAPAPKLSIFLQRQLEDLTRLGQRYGPFNGLHCSPDVCFISIGYSEYKSTPVTRRCAVPLCDDRPVQRLQQQESDVYRNLRCSAWVPYCGGCCRSSPCICHQPGRLPDRCNGCIILQDVRLSHWGRCPDRQEIFPCAPSKAMVCGRHR